MANTQRHVWLIVVPITGGADDGEIGHLRGKPGQVLADADAAHTGRDFAKRTAVRVAGLEEALLEVIAATGRLVPSPKSTQPRSAVNGLGMLE